MRGAAHWGPRARCRCRKGTRAQVEVRCTAASDGCDPAAARLTFWFAPRIDGKSSACRQDLAVLKSSVRHRWTRRRDRRGSRSCSPLLQVLPYAPPQHIRAVLPRSMVRTLKRSGKTRKLCGQTAFMLLGSAPCAVEPPHVPSPRIAERPGRNLARTVFAETQRDPQRSSLRCKRNISRKTRATRHAPLLWVRCDGAPRENAV